MKYLLLVGIFLVGIFLVGCTSDPKPQAPVEFQTTTSGKFESFTTSSCVPINYVHYSTIAQAHHNYFNDTKNFVSNPPSVSKPYWDTRYVNPLFKYLDGATDLNYPDHSVFTGLDTRSGANNSINGSPASTVDASGSLAQTKCVNGVLHGGTTINLHDAPEQTLEYSGPQSTFVYRMEKNLRGPWSTSGNLMMQAHFTKPLYINNGGNAGGGLNFGIFLKNKVNGKYINYIITVYAFENGWVDEQPTMMFDTTTNVVHIGTVIKDGTRWSTKSPHSKTIEKITTVTGEISSQTASDFYRVNITHKNLLSVLQELKANPPAQAVGQDFGLNPADWVVTSIMIQYELEESGGKAILSGSFQGFDTYFTDKPL